MKLVYNSAWLALKENKPNSGYIPLWIDFISQSTEKRMNNINSLHTNGIFLLVRYVIMDYGHS